MWFLVSFVFVLYARHQCALCCNDVMDQMRLTGPLHATKKLLDGGASLEAMLKKMKQVIGQVFLRVLVCFFVWACIVCRKVMRIDYHIRMFVNLS